MMIMLSTWPQLDISPCSYQSYSVIVLILLYLAAPFFTAQGCFCLPYHTFLTIRTIKVVRTKDVKDAVYNSVCMCAVVMLQGFDVDQKDRALESTCILKPIALDTLFNNHLRHTYLSHT